ncbi:AfsA-related hotdog domain-containing protein [Streptomyces sp. NPDC026589]|uniref:AfsA-related hotdog domain-containing protein n=1 Tax=Streptomyces sp. NPDC026589 TaxID=3155609 RepID=UPI0033EA3092
MHELRREEVLLTSWSEPEPGRYEVTARRPRGPCLLPSVGGSYDPMLIAESVRQTVPLLSHAVHDVPREYMQAWEALAACLPAGPPVEPHRVDRGSPADVERT